MSSTPPALIARYGANAAPAEADLTPLIEQLLAHRSVRAYLPDPVSDAQLAAIIAAAQSAASSSNLNVWSVVAVRDQGKRARLAELLPDRALDVVGRRAADGAPQIEAALTGMTGIVRADTPTEHAKPPAPMGAGGTRQR